MKRHLLSIALAPALCLTVTVTALAATTVPQVSLQTQLGATPVDTGITTLVTGSQTEHVLVKLDPPAGGLVAVTFASPGMDWQQNSDGSWSAWLSVPAQTAAWTVMVDVASRTGRSSGLIKLTMTTLDLEDRLVITVEPQAGWIHDLIDDFLTPDFCASYLDTYQFPSHAPSPSVWEHCVELLL